MLSYQYRKYHCGDKTILRPSYLHNGISYTGKITSLYWIRAQYSMIVLFSVQCWCYYLDCTNITKSNKAHNSDQNTLWYTRNWSEIHIKRLGKIRMTMICSAICTELCELMQNVSQSAGAFFNAMFSAPHWKHIDYFVKFYLKTKAIFDHLTFWIPVYMSKNMWFQTFTIFPLLSRLITLLYAVFW